jgi:hypothetical protein
MTRPERIATLREFHSRCRPPGLWGPVVRDFSEEARRGIRRETTADLVDCVLGVACAAASILVVVSLIGRHWLVFGASIALLVASGGLFIRRWARRGVFRELRAGGTLLERGQPEMRTERLTSQSP